MEIISQIFGLFSGIEKKDNAAQNSMFVNAHYTALQGALSQENEWHGLMLIKYSQANKNAHTALYIRYVAICLLLVITAISLIGTSK